MVVEFADEPLYKVGDIVTISGDIAPDVLTRFKSYSHDGVNYAWLEIITVDSMDQRPLYIFKHNDYGLTEREITMAVGPW